MPPKPTTRSTSSSSSSSSSSGIPSSSPLDENVSHSSSSDEKNENNEEPENLEPSAQSSSNGTYVPNDIMVQLLSRLAIQSTYPASSSSSPSSSLSGIHEGKGTTVRAPDKFTGSDRTKLRTFLAQCRMAFFADPSKYQSERSKIMYAASYFDSVALSWFEPFLFMDNDDQNLPSFMNSFKEFESELNNMFGDPDIISTAEHKLNRLKMREDHQVSRYITNFRRYQTVVHWDESALMYCFRKGLPSRILDELARRDEKPSSLMELEQIALRIDLRYWERQQERKDQSEPSRPSSYSRSDSYSSKQPFSRSSSSFKPSTSFSSSSSFKRTNPSPFPIGADKKLTPEEKDRRIKNHLCVYCGETGHVALTCPKRTNTSTKPTEVKKFSSSSLKSVHSAPLCADHDQSSSETSLDKEEIVPSAVRATFSLVKQNQGKF
jgi:Ty3 transposon capsid-like protein